MVFLKKLAGRNTRVAEAGVLLGFMAALGGCGSPGAPLPPSLNLPQPVANLTAERRGRLVQLSWTTPTQTTDRAPLKDPVESVLCRRREPVPLAMGPAECQPVANLRLSPGKAVTHEDLLPTDLLSGPGEALCYFVEVKNVRGRTAGPSNLARAIAGSAPAGVTGLDATVTNDGVLLRWEPAVSSANAGPVLHIHREEILPMRSAAGKSASVQPEPPKRQTFQVLLKPGQPQNQALDPTVERGHGYRYSVERVARVPIGGKQLLMYGETSSTVAIEVVDRFAPAAPQGLAAIPVAADGSGTQGAIDLSWSANTETDLAGYLVYRRVMDRVPEKVSGPQPIAGNAFRDLTAVAGVTYNYSVTAVDRSGNESPSSTPVVAALLNSPTP